MNFDTRPLSAGLYLVATPIGTARDITLRGLDILASADAIAAEDTRTAKRLMEIHGVPLGKRPVFAYHDHSGAAVIDRIAALILDGKSVALVSEAGSPLISDPGFELVRALREQDLPVTSAPGPSSVITALGLAGLPTDRFAFAGFLPATSAKRQSVLAELRNVPFTLVFFESPNRLGDSLTDMCNQLGETRQAAVCRELTKRFEDVRRGTLAALRDSYATDGVKGEIVIVVERAANEDVTHATIDAALRDAMQSMRIKDAATTVAGALGLPRRDVYQRALELGKSG